MANLLTNGNFESPVITANNGNYQHYVGAEIDGWQIIGDVDLVNQSVWAAADGVQSMDLNGTDAGSITQTVTGLTPAGTYNLSFAYAIHAYAGSVTRSMDVLANGQVVGSVTTGSLAPNYLFADYDVVADAQGEIVVRFDSTTTGTDMGMVLDKVALVETPALYLTDNTKSLTVSNTTLPFLAKVNYADAPRKTLWARDVDGTPTISEVQESRYFTPFDDIAISHVQLSGPITLADDFEFEVSFVTTSTRNQIILGDSHTESYYINMNADSFKVWAAGAGYNFAFAPHTPQDGKIHTLRVKLTGTDLEVALDGETLRTRTIVPYTGDNNFRVGSSNSLPNTYNFDGIIADVKIWDTGTLVLDMPLDGKYGTDTVVENKATVYGADFSDTAPTTVNAPWIHNAGNSYSIDGSQTGAVTVYFWNLLTLGKCYRVEITTQNSTAGGVRPETSEVNFAFSTGNTTIAWVITPESNQNFNLQADADFDGDITFTIKEIPAQNPLGTAVNFVDADSELFTFDARGFWVSGVNTWTLGDYTSTGSEGAYVQTLGDQSVTIGYSYVTSLTASGFTSGEMRYRQDTDKLIISADGNYTSAPFTATTTRTRVRTGEVQPNAGATFSNISVKRVLEY